MKAKIMRATLFPVAAVVCALALAACSGDISKSNQVMARVGDREITTSYFERQVADLPQSASTSVDGEGKRAVLEGLVDREVLYEQAVKKKIDKGVELNRKFEDLKRELVIKTYLEHELAGKVKVEESEVAGYYQSHPSEFQHREEVRVSQIVVPDESAAREVLERISIKRDFGELAASSSTDQASAARQGDVGWFTYGSLPAEVRDSVFRLREGEVSKPCKTAAGYEIYKVTERRTSSYPLGKVKDAIRAELFAEKTQQEVKALVDGLKKTMVVQVNERLLK